MKISMIMTGNLLFWPDAVFAGCPAFPGYDVDVSIKSCLFSDSYHQSDKTIKGMMVMAEIFDQEQTSIVKFHEGDTVKFFIPSEKDICSKFYINQEWSFHRLKSSFRCAMAFECVEGVCDFLEITPETYSLSAIKNGFKHGSYKPSSSSLQSYYRLLSENSFGMSVGERVIFGSPSGGLILDLQSVSLSPCPEDAMCIWAGSWRVDLKVSVNNHVGVQETNFEMLNFYGEIAASPETKMFKNYEIQVFQPKGRGCQDTGEDCYVKVNIRKLSVSE